MIKIKNERSSSRVQTHKYRFQSYNSGIEDNGRIIPNEFKKNDINQSLVNFVKEVYKR